MITKLPRCHASLLIQLRTCHIPLNQYLHQFKRAESLLCKGCEQVNKMIKHYLQECPAYEEQHTKFRRAVHQEIKSITKVLSDLKMLPHLFEFITGTQ